MPLSSTKLSSTRVSNQMLAPHSAHPPWYQSTTNKEYTYIIYNLYLPKSATECRAIEYIGLWHAVFVHALYSIDWPASRHVTNKTVWLGLHRLQNPFRLSVLHPFHTYAYYTTHTLRSFNAARSAHCHITTTGRSILLIRLPVIKSLWPYQFFPLKP